MGQQCGCNIEEGEGEEVICGNSSQLKKSLLYCVQPGKMKSVKDQTHIDLSRNDDDFESKS